ncbi:hypothetical protein Bhyg_05122 [Pseudolycoriella hygida]|uniref:Uncharacterized protein n=1 Tax=Pseudolycoriella hygida TaxID=35572 RepID=A0A9Q0NHL4_9DIPT|nr:hypothetical protein Bhyg_05122 [Pseudolycoriella hygida]
MSRDDKFCVVLSPFNFQQIQRELDF